MRTAPFIITVPQAIGGAAKRKPPFFRTKKVGILGNTESIQFAPWADPTWTLIAHPCCRPKCKREPEWYFDLHRPECFQNEAKVWNKRYYTWLQNLQTPIFMQHDSWSKPKMKDEYGDLAESPWAKIPLAVRYPFEMVEAEFGSSVTSRLFISNHCDYMIALAMMEGVTTIGLFGCQYSGPERSIQRESLYYWMGRFEERGGKLVIPHRFNSLFKVPLYGYESHDERGRLIEAYRVKKIETDTAKAGEAAKLTILDNDALPALLPPPNGEPINMEGYNRYYKETVHAIPEGPQALPAQDGERSDPHEAGGLPGGDRVEPDRGDRTTPYESGWRDPSGPSAEGYPESAQLNLPF